MAKLVIEKRVWDALTPYSRGIHQAKYDIVHEKEATE